VKLKLYRYNNRCNVSGEKIREKRLLVKLSQEGLAAKLQLNGFNLNQKAISRIETGERVVPDFELSAFADVLDVSVDWLLSDVNLEN